jgi:hypothetical protein
MVYDDPNSYFSTTPVVQRIMDLIEKHADELTKSWLAEVHSDDGTPTYGSYTDDAELYRRAHRVFGQLGQWINRDVSKEDIRKYWMGVGQQRRREGFPLSEIVQSLGLIRKHFWGKVETEGLLDTSADMYQAMDLHNRVTLFFDRAIYYAVVGYEIA